MNDYDFDVPAGESNAQPDWKGIVEIPSGTFTARLTKAELRVDRDKGQMSVLAEFDVELPGEQNPVSHTEWMTTHRNGTENWASAGRYQQIAKITGLSADQAKNAMIYDKHHEKLSEILSRKVQKVFNLTFVRKDGSKYVNVTDIASLP